VDEATIRAGFFGDFPSRYVCVSFTNEQPFRCVEERLLGVVPRVGDSQPFALD